MLIGVRLELWVGLGSIHLQEEIPHVQRGPLGSLARRHGASGCCLHQQWPVSAGPCWIFELNRGETRCYTDTTERRVRFVRQKLRLKSQPALSCIPDHPLPSRRCPTDLDSARYDLELLYSMWHCGGWHIYGCHLPETLSPSMLVAVLVWVSQIPRVKPSTVRFNTLAGPEPPSRTMTPVPPVPASATTRTFRRAPSWEPLKSIPATSELPPATDTVRSSTETESQGPRVWAWRTESARLPFGSLMNVALAPEPV